jgi:hypothetical protein
LAHLVNDIMPHTGEAALKSGQLELQLATRKQMADLQLAEGAIEQQRAALVRTRCRCASYA